MGKSDHGPSRRRIFRNGIDVCAGLMAAAALPAAASAPSNGNETLKTIHDKYVDPSRVHPRDTFLSALNYVQRDVAQVIVMHEEGAPEVSVRVEAADKKFRVDNIQGPWDVSARLREVFGFLQSKLKGSEVDLREVEYAA